MAIDKSKLFEFEELLKEMGGVINFEREEAKELFRLARLGLDFIEAKKTDDYAVISNKNKEHPAESLLIAFNQAKAAFRDIIEAGKKGDGTSAECDMVYIAEDALKAME
jgi:hypothetical protein